MLNRKPAHSHQPIYQPGKKKKKIQKKLLYLILAIALVIIVLVVVVLTNIKKVEETPKMSSIEETILKEIQMDSKLRDEVLTTSGTVEWENFGDKTPMVKAIVQSMTPYFLNCVAKICGAGDSCSLSQEEIKEFDLETKTFGSTSILISSDLQTLDSRLVKLFCWGNDEEINKFIFEESDVFVYEKDELIEKPECFPETDQEFCLRYGKDCGSFSGTDTCGKTRTVNCGTCTSPETCGGGGLANVCGEEGCVPETNQEFCLRYEKECGVFLETDNCEQIRTAHCGYCNTPETCGGGGLANVCGKAECVPETNETFCFRYGKDCGMFLGIDNCKKNRIANCGSCSAPETCGGGGLANVCGKAECVPETNQEFCLRYGKECSMFSSLDNCGETRTVDCGNCVSPEICINNVCVEPCQPNCVEKCGGADGCGGTCPNTCTGGLVCKAPSYKFCGPESSVEFLGRSLIALPKDNGIYLGWRLLPWDNTNIGFNAYRASNAGGPFTKINSVPIKTSTNYHHQNVPSGTYYYMVRSVNSNGIEGSNSNLAKVTAGTSKDYISIPLSTRSFSDNARDASEIIATDLNGDGVMDFVLLMGYKNDDEYDLSICKDTSLRVEAIMSNPDGTWSSAWRVDTGYKGMNCITGDGFLSAWDLTGDGKAEVITKWGPGGNLAVLSGSDGSLIAITSWPDRPYLYLTIALLEDVTGDGVADPFIVVNSYYGGNKARYSAYRLEGNKLVEKRRLEPPEPDANNLTHPPVWGIGTHGLIAVDLTGNGFDEIVPCGSILYPDWSGYWVVNFGHCDGCSPGDLDPSSPGAEVFMACEKPAEAMLVRLLPGQKPQRLWTFYSYTYHSHHLGFHKAWCGDISVAGYSGMVCVGLELDETANDGIGNTRVFTIPGLEITNNYNWPFRMWMRWPVDWNKGDQTSKILYLTEKHAIADMVGDSREEHVNYLRNSNTLRIFTNTNVLNSRHVTPLADRGYRSGMSRQGNGYATSRILIKTNQPRLDIIPGL